MSKEYQAAAYAYFDGEIAACQRKRAELAADDRVDEATFQRIRENVFDIYKTMITVAGKTAGSDSITGGDSITGSDIAYIKAFFSKKLEQIPQSWQESHDKAAKYENTEKLQTEQIKLQTAAEIRAAFEDDWGEAR